MANKRNYLLKMRCGLTTVGQEITGNRGSLKSFNFIYLSPPNQMIYMHRYTCFVLLLLLFIGCSKKSDVERTNFAEVMIDSKKFTFDELEAVIDTTFSGNSCSVTFKDKASNSELSFKTLTGSDRTIGSYPYKGAMFISPALVYIRLSTYVNGMFSSYDFENSPITVFIDKVKDGRMHGSLAGKAACITCTPYGAEVNIAGEFELAYRYQ